MLYQTKAVEILKAEGLPPNEATRIRQWERFLSCDIEQLIMIKQYRTPQALRSFARLFTLFLPPFYAPYYGQLAVALDRLTYVIVFSILTLVALTSLFESMSQMEDPFVGHRLDCIDLTGELREDFVIKLFDIHNHHLRTAPPFAMPDDLRLPTKKKNERDITNGPVICLMQAY